MRYCLRCCYPENCRPSILFDEHGVCSGCRTFEQRRSETVNWKEKQQELATLLESYKEQARKNNAPYDCIIPISGGKDSHFQAHLITQIYKMKPLFVAYNHAYNTAVGMRNLTNMVDKFGCDLIRYTTNPKTARKISRYMLKKVGDITWHYHAGIMTFPIQIAVRYRIPLMIWGEHGEALLHGMHNLEDKVEFTKKHRQEHLMRGFEPEDILDDPQNKDITRTDLAPFFYPSDDEIGSLNLRGIYLSNYYPWDEFEHTKMVIEKYGFETFQDRQTSFNLYQKVDDFFQDTHNYLKYLKFGYGRVTDQASTEIRNQRLTREQGIELIKKYEHLIRPKNLDIFLKFVEMTEKEFLDNIEHLRDKSAWQKKPNGEWELLDWIGNHAFDKGIEDARLPIKEKWYSLKTPKKDSARNSSDNEDEELIFL
ncbi:MAG: N-acetyl sugar amidotransferase [Nitrosopumilaceae archaeon]|nr:N-acetyl sugar amidotransferase [Nitrosopumilaceae archaeon]